MRADICKLCLKRRNLRDSHYMPRKMYKRLCAAHGRVRGPIYASKALTAATSKHITDYVFCAECENQRFNRCGESYILALIGQGSRFPLRDRMDLAIPDRITNDSAQYSSVRLGIDTEKVGYFALSMIWKGAVHEWRTPFGEKLPILDLGVMREPVRQYLLGEAPFPVAVVMVNVCNDSVSRELLLMPVRSSTQNPYQFEFIALGLHFFVLLGDVTDMYVRELCCVTSTKRVLFRRDCTKRVAQHFAAVEKSTKRSKAIHTEWP
jgi:hypothetical protein